MNLRRLRAIAVMMLVWSIAAGVGGALYGAFRWLVKWHIYNGDLLDSIGLAVGQFSAMGLIAGAGFALILSLRSRHSDDPTLTSLPRTSVWLFLGAAIGGLAYLAWVLATNQWWIFHDVGYSGLLRAIGVFSVIGGAVGTGIIGMARRSTAVGRGEEARVIEG